MTWLLVAIVLVPAVMIVAKRWHDIGRSAWWLLLSFAPFVLLAGVVGMESTIGTTRVSDWVWFFAIPFSQLT